jgi:hypothetical protein
MGYIQETLEEFAPSSLLAKRKRPKLEISTGQTVLEDFEVLSRESSPDHEMSADLSLSKCFVCLRYHTKCSVDELTLNIVAIILVIFFL